MTPRAHWVGWTKIPVRVEKKRNTVPKLESNQQRAAMNGVLTTVHLYSSIKSIDRRSVRVCKILIV